MSWISELSKVYDNTIGWKSDDKPTPMYHITNNASVTITISGEGNFIKAELIDKKDRDRITLMPCTESGMSRTSGIEAYPLCDKLEYIATNPEKHEKYLNLLKSWSESDFATKKVQAVYKYVQKETLLSDLQGVGIEEKDVTDFIRWEVEVRGDIQPALWKDEETFNSWISFYNSDFFDEYCRVNFEKKEDIVKRIRKTALNYVDGKEEKIAVYHPAKIRNGGDSAKLISSNDTSNYTFRGRFLTDNEACQISSETTQKAHSALRWLIKRQGVPLGDGLSVVTWKESGEKIPSIVESSSELEYDFGFEDEEPEKETTYSTAEEFAHAINKKLVGYCGNTLNPQKIMVMAIKEATPGQGRISIALYRELQNTDMLESLDNWYNRLSWYRSYWSKEKNANGKSCRIHSIGTPSPKEIAECAYGERVKPQLVEKTVQRLLPCILDGGVIPSDLVTQCVKSASNLMIIDTDAKRENVLETACAVYKYNNIKEEYKLALEENRTSRDYLFGRLLAVEQQYENAALKKAGQERETNAVRYMQQYSVHPSKTWLMLYKDKLPAYRRHLDVGLKEWFEKQIQDITALFENDDYMNDKSLSGEFLLGYQCQLKAFRKNNDEQSEENMEE